jgi:hypothetical protein
VPSQRPGRSRDENSHDLSFRMALSPEDKAPPDAVTLSGLAWPRLLCRLVVGAPDAARRLS